MCVIDKGGREGKRGESIYPGSRAHALVVWLGL